jgi:hypothetical protein
VPEARDEKSEKGTVAPVIGQAMGDVEAEPVPLTLWEATPMPPGELNDTVPEHEPPVIVSPVKLTDTEGTKLMAVPPPPLQPQLTESVGVVGKTWTLVPFA